METGYSQVLQMEIRIKIKKEIILFVKNIIKNENTSVLKKLTL